MKNFFIYAFCSIFVCLLSGCIEAVDSLTIYGDGSCLESKSISVSSAIPSNFDQSEIKAFEKDGYEVRFFSKKDKTDIFITKRFSSFEEYCSFVSSSDRMYSGKVKCEIEDINLVFFRRIKIRESVKPSDNSSISDGIANSMFSEKRVITLPYEIISSNADVVKENTASWTIDSERRNSEYIREAVCLNVNYALIIVTAAVAGTILFMLQRKSR